MEYLIRANKKIEIFAPKTVYQTNTISKFHSGLQDNIKYTPNKES